MALKKFIGARYAPEFAGEWSNTKQYAALSVVYTDNRSYVSRKTVPAGTAISNTEFWIQSSDWNAQVAEYNLKVEGYNQNVEQYNKNVQDYAAAVSGFYADTLHSFDTKAEMQADRTLALGETLLTCGDKKIGDGGGSFYQVVSQTSSTAVALDNGLFAEPFEFQPYDYSQFQQEVEGYKNSTTRVYNVQSDMVADAGINAGNVLMTTGAVEAGDGQGSFWNVSDEQSEGAVTLNNGKYAKRFNLTSVDVSGNLLFNGKGNQVAIWGIKAGGEAVNVPVSYALGETRTVYVAVEYTPDNTNATVNLVVSGPTSFTKTFAWSDASVTAGQVKTVMYAITVHSAGNNVYTGAQTVTSYLTTLEKFVERFTVYIPDVNTAKNVWASATATQLNAPFTVNKTISLLDLTTYAKTNTSDYVTATIYGDNDKDIYYLTNNTTNTSTARLDTHTANVVLSPAKNYKIGVRPNKSSGNITTPSNVTGTYGAFTFNNSPYNGEINYQATTLTHKTEIVNPNSWTGSDVNSAVAYFTVTKKICLETFSFTATSDSSIGNYMGLALGEYVDDYDSILLYERREPDERHTITNNLTYNIMTVLEPGTTYAMSLRSDTIKGPTASAIGTHGPFVFKAVGDNNGNFGGTFTYTELD